MSHTECDKNNQNFNQKLPDNFQNLSQDTLTVSGPAPAFTKILEPVNFNDELKNSQTSLKDNRIYGPQENKLVFDNGSELKYRNWYQNAELLWPSSPPPKKF